VLVKNLQNIKEKITISAEKDNRSLNDIKLVAVTKNVPIEKIKDIIDLGITDIGENRIQEAQDKFNQLQSENYKIGQYKWHMIGHLQTNKAKYAVQMFDLIQSVDSLRLAEEINKQAKKINKIQDCLVELKVSEEETKFGCPQENIEKLIKEIKDFENIRIPGIMSMAPYFYEAEKARPYFQKTKQVFENVKSTFGFDSAVFNVLSMGMSGDFQIAIEEGANLVRIGTAIFKAACSHE